MSFKENRNLDNNRDIRKGILGIILIIGFPLALATFSIFVPYAKYRSDQKIWNNGVCKCNGNWELMHIAPFEMRTGTIYHYECDTCKEVFESNTHWE